jgi:hypothetical protein
VKELDDVALTLEQVNEIAAAADAIDAQPDTKGKGWAFSIAAWKKGHEIKGDAWVKRESEVAKQSPDYMAKLLEFVKERLPGLVAQFHTSARGYAGGKASGRAKQERKALEDGEPEGDVAKAGLDVSDVHIDGQVETMAEDEQTGKTCPGWDACPYREQENGPEADVAKSDDDLMLSEARELVEKAAVQGYAEIVKADKREQKVWAVVLEPYEIDTQGDWLEPGEIAKAAHGWMERYQRSGVNHTGEPKTDLRPVESYVAPTDFQLGDQPVRKGSWILGLHVKDAETWAKVESGELSGFSIQGYGRRTPVPLAKGGEGSGNFGHAGQGNGKVGGSAPSGMAVAGSVRNGDEELAAPVIEPMQEMINIKGQMKPLVATAITMGKIGPDTNLDTVTVTSWRPGHPSKELPLGDESKQLVTQYWNAQRRLANGSMKAATDRAVGDAVQRQRVRIWGREITAKFPGTSVISGKSFQAGDTVIGAPPGDFGWRGWAIALPDEV